MSNKVRFFYKGFKFRLYPTKEQIALLLQHCGNTRFLWNLILRQNIKVYDKTGKFVFYNEIASKLPFLKKKFPFLAISFSQSLQQVAMQFEKALKESFKGGKGFPKFKKYNNGDSFQCPQKWHYNKGSIYIPKIGNVKWVKHRGMKGKPKSITISRDVDQWYVSVLCEIPIPEKVKISNKELSSDKILGLDVGVVRLATTSDNHYHKALNLTVETEKIKTLQRELDRRKKKSKNWKKTKVKLQKANRTLRRKRSFKLHKYSFRLVERTKVIFVEDLKIKNMTRSSKGTIEKPGKNVKAKSGLNREITKQSWGTLFSMLEYKLRFSGKVFGVIDPRHTSQCCNECDFTSKRNRVSQSEFKCVKCGHEENADYNAACNIRDRGIKQYLTA